MQETSFATTLQDEDLQIIESTLSANPFCFLLGRDKDKILYPSKFSSKAHALTTGLCICPCQPHYIYSGAIYYGAI